ncbi:MAG: hypothetical protein D6722_05045 [Bacteroidetes bacterium]|nr:MAG: hypothetical protein D6722_05045 [Bacteroidota bacterium]
MQDMSFEALKKHYEGMKFRNPRDKRLAREHLRLAELCDQTDRITYRLPEGKKLPPDTYIIGYHLRSIVAQGGESGPEYGNYHEVKITFPANFPVGGAACYMLSPAWHPNIKWDGPYKGRICGNTAEFGSLYYLNMLVLRVGEILQWKNYHAEQIHPFPEDENVARWVREVAEPRGWVQKHQPVDESSLLKPLHMASEPEPPADPPPPPSPEATPPPPEPKGDTPRKKIQIKSSRHTSRDEEEGSGRGGIKIRPR